MVKLKIGLNRLSWDALLTPQWGGQIYHLSLRGNIKIVQIRTKVSAFLGQPMQSNPMARLPNRDSLMLNLPLSLVEAEKLRTIKSLGGT